MGNTDCLGYFISFLAQKRQKGGGRDCSRGCEKRRNLHFQKAALLARQRPRRLQRPRAEDKGGQQVGARLAKLARSPFLAHAPETRFSSAKPARSRPAALAGAVTAGGGAAGGTEQPRPPAGAPPRPLLPPGPGAARRGGLRRGKMERPPGGGRTTAPRRQQRPRRRAGRPVGPLRTSAPRPRPLVRAAPRAGGAGPPPPPPGTGRPAASPAARLLQFPPFRPTPRGRGLPCASQHLRGLHRFVHPWA